MLKMLNRWRYAKPEHVADRAARGLDAQDVAARRIRTHRLAREWRIEVAKAQTTVAIVLVGGAEEQRPEERSLV